MDAGRATELKTKLQQAVGGSTDRIFELLIEMGTYVGVSWACQICQAGRVNGPIEDQASIFEEAAGHRKELDHDVSMSISIFTSPQDPHERNLRYAGSEGAAARLDARRANICDEPGCTSDVHTLAYRTPMDVFKLAARNDGTVELLAFHEGDQVLSVTGLRLAPHDTH